MESKEYFDRMQETSEAVDQVIFRSLVHLMTSNRHLYEIVATLPKRREGRPKLRAHFARESYEICGGKDPREWQHLGAAVELELNAMYYKNQVFDDKAYCSSSDSRSVIDNWTAESYSRNLAEQSLHRAYFKERDELAKLLCEADQTFNQGMFQDVTQNTCNNIGHLSFEEQIKLCDQRIYRINASFFEKIARMGSIVADNYSPSQYSALANFGRAWGMAAQIINDTTDFIPPRLQSGTTEKTAEDAYSDVLHGKMTYPIIWMLHNGNEEQRKYLRRIVDYPGMNRAPNNPGDLEELTKMLIQSGAIDFAKQKAREYRNQAKRSLHEAFSKHDRRFLSSMCVMLDSNRYDKALKEFIEKGGPK